MGHQTQGTDAVDVVGIDGTRRVQPGEILVQAACLMDHRRCQPGRPGTHAEIEIPRIFVGRRIDRQGINPVVRVSQARSSILCRDNSDPPAASRTLTRLSPVTSFTCPFTAESTASGGARTGIFLFGERPSRQRARRRAPVQTAGGCLHAQSGVPREGEAKRGHTLARRFRVPAGAVRWPMSQFPPREARPGGCFRKADFPVARPQARPLL